MKKGDNVKVKEQWVVKDQGAKCNKGKVVKLWSEKAYGYKNQYNNYVKLKMVDGTTFVFNQEEVKKVK
jgi:hypothetical protein